MGRRSQEVSDAREEFLSEWLKYKTNISSSMKKRWLKVYDYLVWRQDLVAKFTPSLIHSPMFETTPWPGGKRGLSPELMMEIVQSPEAYQDEFLAALEEGKDSEEYVSVRQVWNRVKGTCVYLIEDGRGNIKIGHSNDVSNRLKEFQTANSSNLKITKTYFFKSAAEAKSVEEALHKAFDKDRIRREWFRSSACDRIEDVIRQIKEDLKKTQRTTRRR